MRSQLLASAFLALVLPACGTTSPGAAATDAAADVASAADVPVLVDTPAATDQGVIVDVVTATDAGTPAALNGCTPDGYVDQTAGTANDRMIMTRGSTNTFDFPCMTIRTGQAVMFMWTFSRHPLTPGLAPGQEGTAPDPTPIVPFATGSAHSITFRTPGFYPFYCSAHPGTMMGVVQVL